MCQVNTGMEVACFDPLILPCADCGLLTGQFCDGGERDLRDYTIPVIGGLPCLAVDTVGRADGRHHELVMLGHSARVIPADQRTPLCSRCCSASQVHSADGKISPDLCHFCLDQKHPPPPMNGTVHRDALASWAPR